MDALAQVAHKLLDKRLHALRCVNLKKAIQVRNAKRQARKAMLDKRADAIRRYHAARKVLEADTEPEDEIIETDE